MGNTSPTAVPLLVRGSELVRKSMVFLFLGQKCAKMHYFTPNTSKSFWGGEGTPSPEPTP